MSKTIEPVTTDAAITETDTVLVRRKELDDLERLAYSKLEPLPSTLEEFWVDIPLSDTWLSHTLIVRPKSNSTGVPTQQRPLIIHFYGGGYMAGSPIQVAHPARLFAERFNATVLCPSYRLTPEHPWPQPMKDGLEILQLIAADPAHHYGADPTHGFILGGVSAGAGVAAVAAGLVTQDPTKYPLSRPLTGVFISVPLLLVERIVPPEHKHTWTSRHDNCNAMALDTAAVDGILLRLKCTDYTSPWFSPVNVFSPTDTSKVKHPPTYIQAMALDPLRDDAVIYEKVLSAAGVKTKIHVFPEDEHNALSTFNPIFGTKSKDPTIEEGSLEGVEWLLK